MNFKKPVQALLATAILAVLSSAADAAVRYDFTALTAYEFDGETVSGSFSLVVPDFISADSDFAASALESCAVSMTPSVPVTCGNQVFSLSQDPTHATVEFGSLSTAIGDLHTYYYFDQGAFGAVGTYSSELLGDAQEGTLTVSEVSSVPEPANLAMLLAGGLGLVAFGRRRTGSPRRTWRRANPTRGLNAAPSAPAPRRTWPAGRPRRRRAHSRRTRASSPARGRASPPRCRSPR